MTPVSVPTKPIYTSKETRRESISHQVVMFKISRHDSQGNVAAAARIIRGIAII